MRELLTLEFNIMVLILVGCLIRRLDIIGDQGKRDITNLVLYVVLPCNTVNSFVTRLPEDMVGDCLWVLGISIGIQIVAVLYGRLFFKGLPDAQRRNIAFALICSNAGFLGNPIAEGVYGPVGLVLASIYLIPLRVMMWSEGLAIYTGNSDPRVAAKKVLTHPCVIACFLGIAIMLTGVQIPGPILLPVQTFAKCNTALSMLLIGMILAEIDPHTLVDKTVARFTFHRLVVLPLCVYVACLFLPISDTVRGVSVLLAAMPAGATTTMLASKYEQDPRFATKLVIFSTLWSIPAIVLWNMVLRG